MQGRENMEQLMSNVKITIWNAIISEGLVETFPSEPLSPCAGVAFNIRSRGSPIESDLQVTASKQNPSASLNVLLVSGVSEVDRPIYH